MTSSLWKIWRILLIVLKWRSAAIVSCNDTTKLAHICACSRLNSLRGCEFGLELFHNHNWRVTLITARLPDDLLCLTWNAGSKTQKCEHVQVWSCTKSASMTWFRSCLSLAKICSKAPIASSLLSITTCKQAYQLPHPFGLIERGVRHWVWLCIYILHIRLSLITASCVHSTLQLCSSNQCNTAHLESKLTHRSNHVHLIPWDWTLVFKQGSTPRLPTTTPLYKSMTCSAIQGV